VATVGPSVVQEWSCIVFSGLFAASAKCFVYTLPANNNKSSGLRGISILIFFAFDIVFNLFFKLMNVFLALCL
jgi:hypothetical protein